MKKDTSISKQQSAKHASSAPNDPPPIAVRQVPEAAFASTHAGIASDELLIFIGYSEDARRAVSRLKSLESDIQDDLRRFDRVQASRGSFRRVKMFEWNADSSPQVGGQLNAIDPVVDRANIAIFVFQDRTGPVTWAELEHCRKRRIPVIAAFAAAPSYSPDWSNRELLAAWLDLLDKKRSLTSDWSSPHSVSLKPIQDYSDHDELASIVLREIRLVLPSVCEMPQNYAVAADGRPITQTHAIRSIEELRLANEAVLQSRRPCFEAALDDLDWDLVREFGSKELGEAGSHVPDLDLAVRLKLVSPLVVSSPPVLHTAAVLCFSQWPSRSLPQAEVVVTIGKPSDRHIVREDVCGPLAAQIDKAHALVMRHLDNVSTIGDGSRRKESPEIPERLVREVIANAVLHRDYALSSTVQIRLLPTALEVQSPGAFPAGITWDGLLATDVGSHPVDPSIAYYLVRSGTVERIGRGFGLIRRHIKEYGPGSITCESLPGPAMCLRILRRDGRHDDKRAATDGADVAAGHAGSGPLKSTAVRRGGAARRPKEPLKRAELMTGRPRLISTDQVATIFGVSIHTIRKYADLGIIWHCDMNGNQRLYDSRVVLTCYRMFRMHRANMSIRRLARMLPELVMKEGEHAKERTKSTEKGMVAEKKRSR